MKNLIPLHEFHEPGSNKEYLMFTPIDQLDKHIRQYSASEQFVYFLVLIVLTTDKRFDKYLEFDRLQIIQKNKNEPGLLLSDVFNDQRFFDAFERITSVQFNTTTPNNFYYEFVPSDAKELVETVRSVADNNMYFPYLENLKNKVKTTVKISFADFNEDKLDGLKVKY